MYRGSTFITALIILLIFALVPLHAAFWDIDLIYSGGFAAGDTSLALSPAGIPSISYTVNSNLYLATKTLTGWNWELVSAVGFWGGWSSLSFNSLGQPCAAFIDGSGTTNNLKYAYKVSGSWFNETVDDVGWMPDYVSLSYNPSGQACIAYCKTTGTYPDTHSYVCFARRTGTNLWVKQTIVEVGSITGPSLVIDSHDVAYIGFTDSATGKLRMASKVGTGTWSVQDVDGSTSSPALWYTSVALTREGTPAVAYFQGAAGSVSLKLASKDNVWKTEDCAVVTSGTSYYCSLGFTAENKPLIVYYDPGVGLFKHTWKSGGAWYSQIIDLSPQSGLRPSLRIDSLGNAIASYFDNNAGSVKCASAIVPVSVKKARGLTDGTLVQISGAIASTAGGEMGSRVYVQEADRSSGIQLYFSTTVLPVSRGMVLDIQGQMTTIEGERAVNDPDLVQILSAPAPKPLGLSNLTFGGGDSGGIGLSTSGLLVRTYGRVKSHGTDYFIVDDGSGIMLKCSAPGITLPAINSFVLITGTSARETAGTGFTRLIRVRSAGDIKAM